MVTMVSSKLADLGVLDGYDGWYEHLSKPQAALNRRVTLYEAIGTWLSIGGNYGDTDVIHPFR
jgi:hypothetical protein